jgi:hypothetical protein
MHMRRGPFSCGVIDASFCTFQAFQHELCREMQSNEMTGRLHAAFDFQYFKQAWDFGPIRLHVVIFISVWKPSRHGRHQVKINKVLDLFRQSWAVCIAEIFNIELFE